MQKTSKSPPSLPFGGVPTKAVNQHHGCQAAANSFFRAVAKEVGLAKDQFNIRYNACGEYGETTFHTATVYMHVNFDVPLDYHLGLLGRTCKGHKDFIGGPNQWLSTKESTLNAVIALYQRLLVGPQQPTEESLEMERLRADWGGYL